MTEKNIKNENNEANEKPIKEKIIGKFSDDKINKYLKIICAVAVTLIVLYFINNLFGEPLRKFFSTLGIIVTSFVLAYLLSILLEPVMDFLQKIKIKNVNARAGIVTIFFLGLIVLIIFLIIVPAIKSFVLTATSGDVVERVKLAYQKFLNVLPGFLSDYLKSYTTDIGHTVSRLDMDKVIPVIIGAMGGIVKIVITIVYTFLFLFFMLKERDRLLDSFETIMPKSFIRHYDKFTETSEVVFREYIKGYFTVIMILFLMSYFTFLIIGGIAGQSELVKYAILFAFILGITDFIPYIGPWIGSAVVIIISVIVITSFGTLIAIGIALITFQMIESLILQPVIMGNRVHVHPLGIFTAILIFSSMGIGLLGVVLAAPITGLIKLTFNYIKKEVQEKKKGEIDV